jgi:hypothetical protein
MDDAHMIVQRGDLLRLGWNKPYPFLRLLAARWNR